MTRRKQFQKILFAFFCLLVLLCAFLAVCFPHSHSSVDSDCHVCLLQELYHYVFCMLLFGIFTYAVLQRDLGAPCRHTFLLRGKTLVDVKVKLSQ